MSQKEALIHFIYSLILMNTILIGSVFGFFYCLFEQCCTERVSWRLASSCVLLNTVIYVFGLLDLVLSISGIAGDFTIKPYTDQICDWLSSRFTTFREPPSEKPASDKESAIHSAIESRRKASSLVNNNNKVIGPTSTKSDRTPRVLFYNFMQALSMQWRTIVIYTFLCKMRINTTTEHLSTFVFRRFIVVSINAILGGQTMWREEKIKSTLKAKNQAK